MDTLNPVLCSTPKLRPLLSLTNRLVDLVGEVYDLAIRTGQMPDSSLIRARVCSGALLTYATRSYLASAAPIERVEDLKHHACPLRSASNWHFKDAQGQALEF
ncbi:LysR substrate-binding domain-containing protein [Aquidulcibacter sp.]|uniref:LysR substrate-binding domain-containing protein n=1 Tax=Aquidulcibacter sp. TaxID=2052990 RepID=UPI0028B1FE5B|nr:LysR substrate-binding domain-containing protein [Aquidulcibacter sp.]